MNLLSAFNDKFKMKTLTMNGYLRVNIKYLHVYKNTGLKYVIKESLVVSFGIFFNSLYVSCMFLFPRHGQLENIHNLLDKNHLPSQIIRDILL